MKKVTIFAGQEIPFFYGLIGPNYAIFNGNYFALIPFNYIYILWYFILRHARPTKFMVKIDKMKRDCFDDGRKRGYEVGYARGKIEGERELFKKLRDFKE